MKWITRERPKIDRIACPWLIKNFVDPLAEFIYVPKDKVFAQAKLLNAIPYDIPGAEYSHEGNFCTFDFIIKKHNISDSAIDQIALIVRGADTGSFELAPQAAGLWAISAGLSYNVKDDHEQPAIGLKVYDALCSWAKNMFMMKNIHGHLKFETPFMNVATATCLLHFSPFHILSGYLRSAGFYFQFICLRTVTQTSKSNGNGYEQNHKQHSQFGY